MPTTDEEILISVVVVRRPLMANQPETDPNRWAESILEQCSPGKVSYGRGQRFPAVSLSHASEVRKTSWLRLVWCLLGTICLIGSVFSFLLFATKS